MMIRITLSSQEKSELAKIRDRPGKSQVRRKAEATLKANRLSSALRRLGISGPFEE